jgi:cellobiose-specific phosphotransferase system component IIC
MIAAASMCFLIFGIIGCIFVGYRLKKSRTYKKLGVLCVSGAGLFLSIALLLLLQNKTDIPTLITISIFGLF